MYFCILQLVKNGENSISRATLSSSSYRCKQLTQQLSVIFKVPINQFASIIYITNTGSFPNKCYSEDKTYLVQHSPFKHRWKLLLARLSQQHSSSRLLLFTERGAEVRRRRSHVSLCVHKLVKLVWTCLVFTGIFMMAFRSFIRKIPANSAG